VITVPGKILIGPVSDPALLGPYLHHPQIRAFMYSPTRIHITEPLETDPHLYATLYPLHELDLQGWLETQIATWQPDVLIWVAASPQAPPAAILNAPLRKIALMHDWPMNAFGAKLVVQHFDHVFGDQALVQHSGQEHVRYWPHYSWDPARFYPPPSNSARPYDVTFIGSISSLVVPARTHLLAKLLALPPNIRVLCTNWIFGDAYRELLQQSKIVLNLAQRGEANLRTYEAIACGALLLQEQGNREVEAILTPHKSYIPYTEDILTPIQAYLAAPEQRAQIVAHAQQELAGHTYQQRFEQLLQRLPQLQRRVTPLFPQSLQEHLSYARSQLMALYPDRIPRALRILEACQRQFVHASAPEQGLIAHALAAVAMNGFIHPLPHPLQRPLHEFAGPLQQIRHSLERAVSAYPAHPAPRYNLAWAQALLGEHSAAQTSLTAVEHLMAPFIPEADDPLLWFLMPLRVQYACYGELQNRTEKDWLQGFLPTEFMRWWKWLLAQMRGDLAYHQQAWKEALRHYHTALEIKPNHDQSLLMQGFCYLALGQINQGEAALKAHLTANPFALDVQLTLIQIYLQQGRMGEARQALPVAHLLAQRLQLKGNPRTQEIAKLAARLGVSLVS
jgi:tetratricopeptide (TPR) repeat protein